MSFLGWASVEEVGVWDTLEIHGLLSPVEALTHFTRQMTRERYSASLGTGSQSSNNVKVIGFSYLLQLLLRVNLPYNCSTYVVSPERMALEPFMVTYHLKIALSTLISLLPDEVSEICNPYKGIRHLSFSDNLALPNFMYIVCITAIVLSTHARQ